MSLRSLSLSVFALLTASLSVAACSATGSPPSEFDEEGDDNIAPIIGGTVDKGDPSVVMMKAQSGNIGWSCTGTVIAKRLVLTAAHCVEDATSSTKIQVLFGYDQSLAKASDYVQVKEWRSDPQYMITNNIAAGHDAAVLILASDALAPVQPINRKPLTKDMVGTPVHVVGFGNNNGQAGTGAGIKREIFTTIHSLEQGVVNVGRPGQSTCQGDSGGPTFMKINGVDTVIGITSYGEYGCVNYGSSTRVDLSASWIDPFIAANGGDPGTCTPSCDGKQCGDDGCGGTCGQCGAGESCSSAGTCEVSPGGCTPSCGGKQCGDDGCGGVCGKCGTGESCSSAGQCVAPPPQPGACSEAEPNNSTSKATPLCSQGVMTGLIESWADNDYYTFKVGAGKTYDITLETQHEFVMTLYKVVNGGLYQIVSSFDQIKKTTPDGGTYYLEVWGGNGDYSPTDPYKLGVVIK